MIIGRLLLIYDVIIITRVGYSIANLDFVIVTHRNVKLSPWCTATDLTEWGTALAVAPSRPPPSVVRCPLSSRLAFASCLFASNGNAPRREPVRRLVEAKAWHGK